MRGDAAAVVGVDGCVGVVFSSLSSAMLFLPNLVRGSLLLPTDPLPHQPELDEPDEVPSRLTGRSDSPGGLPLREWLGSNAPSRYVVACVAR